MAKYQRCTIGDVAGKAGVSRTTASHILNNRHPYVDQFTEETKERVLRLAHELNYCPNIMAAGLRSGKSKLVGLVLDDCWRDPTLRELAALAEGELLSGACRIAREHGNMPVIHLVANHTEESDQEVVRTLASTGLGGLVVKSPHWRSNRLLSKFMDEQFPLVVIFPGSIDHLPGNWVDMDNLTAGRMVANYLVSKGYRRIDWLALDEPLGYLNLRYQGFIEVLRELGLAQQSRRLVMPTVDGRLSIEACIQQVLSGEKPDALVSCDSSANQVVRYFHTRGEQTGDYFALMGFDCRRWADQDFRGVSSVELSWDLAGQVAMTMLCDLIKHGHRHVQPRLLPPILAAGETTPER